MDAIDNRPDSSRRGFFQVMILGFLALFGIGCIVRTPGPRPRRGRTTRVRRGRRRGRRGTTVRTSRRRTQRGRRGRGAAVRTRRSRRRRRWTPT